MIARHYGLDIDYKYLCSLADSDRQGLSVVEMTNLLGKLQFDSIAVNLDIKYVEKMPLPAIIFVDQKHFVVLYRVNIKKGLFYIADPAAGKMKLKYDDFISRFCREENKRGIAIVIEPRDDFSPDAFPKNNTFRGLCKFMSESARNHLTSLRWIALALLFILATDIAMPFLFQTTIDKGIGNKDISLIWLLAASQLFIFLGGYCSNSITNLILTKIGLKVSIDMLNKYLNKLLSLPMNFYSRHSPADLVQRIDDQNRIKDFLLSMPSTIIFTVLNFIVFSVIMLWFSPLIYAIFMVISLLNLGWMTLFLRFRREIDYPLMGKMGENRNNLYEIISGIEEIKASKAQEARISGWRKDQEFINKFSLRGAFLRIYQNGGDQLLEKIRNAVITGLCATFVVQDQMTIGIMMTVSYIAGHLSQPINSIMSSVNSVQDSMISYQRLDGIINEEHQTNSENKIDSILDWELRNVGFKYPGAASPLILKDCSLKIPIGKSLAIVGESGCGKSTILKLLIGSYLPSEGSIIINGHPFDSVDEQSFATNLGMVMQNGTIYSASILANIGFSDIEPDLEKVKQAARLACIDSFIESLPMKYNTKIGTTGIQLSGGQAQRIFIARALYRNPPVMILDEATSSLDAITEAQIMENIFDFCKGRTLIIAAHRLSTVCNADKIVVLKNGRIAEEGKHHHLIEEEEGIYSNLVRKQLVV